MCVSVCDYIIAKSYIKVIVKYISLLGLNLLLFFYSERFSILRLYTDFCCVRTWTAVKLDCSCFTVSHDTCVQKYTLLLCRKYRCTAALILTRHIE